VPSLADADELTLLTRGQPNDAELTDAELTELALAADPDVELDDDAVAVCLDDGAPALLPAWYLPAATGGVRPRRGWRRRVALTLIVSFLLVDACGLCCTYGALVLA
jgi:hypothetical protein